MTKNVRIMFAFCLIPKGIARCNYTKYFYKWYCTEINIMLLKHKKLELIPLYRTVVKFHRIWKFSM